MEGYAFSSPPSHCVSVRQAHRSVGLLREVPDRPHGPRPWSILPLEGRALEGRAPRPSGLPGMRSAGTFRAWQAAVLGRTCPQFPGWAHMPMEFLHGRPLSPEELELFRRQVEEGFEVIAVVDDEVRGMSLGTGPTCWRSFRRKNNENGSERHRRARILCHAVPSVPRSPNRSGRVL
jgi:hypothetical protein